MLAIVIPYYKITFFETTLKSLADQTNQRFKVYIGDDASPEDCSNLLKKFESKVEIVYHRFEDNLGGYSLTKQWERCLNLVDDQTIEWIMILGDDDTLGNNIVENFYSNLSEIEKLSIKVVRYATQKINDKTEIISNVYLHPKIEKSTEFLCRQSRSSLSEYIFNAKKIKDVGFKNYPLAWHSDRVAVLEVSEFHNVYSINDAVVNIRYSTINISGREDNIREKNDATVLFYRYILKSIDNFENKDYMLNLIEKAYLKDKKRLMLFYQINRFLISNLEIKKLIIFYKKIASSLMQSIMSR